MRDHRYSHPRTVAVATALGFLCALILDGVAAVPTSVHLDGTSPGPPLAYNPAVVGAGNTMAPFSLGAWFRVSSIGTGFRALVSKSGVAGLTPNVIALGIGDSTLCGTAAGSCVVLRINGQTITDGTTVPLNTWVQATGEYDGTYAWMYRNGVAQVQWDQLPIMFMSLSPLAPFVVGCLAPVTGAPTNVFIGDIDNVRVFTGTTFGAGWNQQLLGTENYLLSYLSFRQFPAGSGTLVAVEGAANAPGGFVAAATGVTMLTGSSACSSAGCGSPIDNVNGCATNNGGCGYAVCTASPFTVSCGTCVSGYTVGCTVPPPNFCSLPPQTGFPAGTSIYVNGVDWPGSDIPGGTTTDPTICTSAATCQAWCVSNFPTSPMAVVITTAQGSPVCACKYVSTIGAVQNARVRGFPLTSPIPNVPPSGYFSGYTGAVTLNCPSGYSMGVGSTLQCPATGGVLTGSIGTCVDIDECATNNGGCGAFATCINEPGTYSCVKVIPSIAAQFAPIVQFAPWEQYWPTSIDNILNSPNSFLKCHSNPSLSIANPTQAQLQQYNSRGNPEDCYVVIDPAKAPGDPRVAYGDGTYRVTSPMYYAQQYNSAFVEIHYIMVYAANGATTTRWFGANPFNAVLTNLGVHPGDIERVTVRLNPALTAILSVGFWAHGNVAFYQPNEIKMSGTHPIVQSAFLTHGCYPAFPSGSSQASDWVVVQDLGIPLGVVSRTVSSVSIIDLLMYQGNSNAAIWRPFDSPDTSLIPVGLDNAGVVLPPPPGTSIPSQLWSYFAGRFGGVGTTSFVSCQDVAYATGGTLSKAAASTCNTVLNLAAQLPCALPTASNGPTGLAAASWTIGMFSPLTTFTNWTMMPIAISAVTTTTTRPSVVYHPGTGQWLMVFRGSSGGLYVYARNPSTLAWAQLSFNSIATFSSGPKAFITGTPGGGNVLLHAIGRSGSGAELMHYNSADGGNTWQSTTAWDLGITCNGDPSAWGNADGSFVAVCADGDTLHENGIMLSYVSSSAVVTTTFTGFATNVGVQPLIVYFNGAYQIYYQEEDDSQLAHITTTANPPTSGWVAANPLHPGGSPNGVQLSGGPGGVVLGSVLHLLFRDGDTNADGMLHWHTDGGLGPGDAYDPQYYVGVNCNGAVDVACDPTSDCIAVCAYTGGAISMAEAAPWLMQ